MPELPEVETTRRGIAPHLVERTITSVIVRESRLRWPIPAELPELLAETYIKNVDRRAKYLLLRTDKGTIILHLGMSGSLRITQIHTDPRKHDHVDFMLDSQRILRLHDPRRFGCLLWTSDDPLQHPLLVNLGPEPLTDQFDGQYLYDRSRQRQMPVKSFIMDNQVVVGVGNIYANEALHWAGIHPLRAAGRISLARYQKLATGIRTVLADAIIAGGTTLRDFTDGDGKAGYFRQQLRVYGRARSACLQCGETISHQVLGQRATYFCHICQR
jgi:formamidopyrimidine-DNA glycosylase